MKKMISLIVMVIIFTTCFGCNNAKKDITDKVYDTNVCPK